jgi:hypothetical protein
MRMASHWRSFLFPTPQALLLIIRPLRLELQAESEEEKQRFGYGLADAL